MLRFNAAKFNSTTVSQLFQYILCYGSTVFGYCAHHRSNAFQYILCYGSTFHGLRHTCATLYFNTSYVTVQPDIPRKI